LLELGDRRRHVTVQQGRVPRQRFPQSGGGNVLGHGVHPIGEPLLICHRGPGGGGLFVGHSAEQERAGGEHPSRTPVAISWSKKGSCQPPCWNPSPPPGSSRTPSSVRNMARATLL